MKSLDRAISRFCYKHPAFGIRNLMLFIVIANLIVYVFAQMDTTGTLIPLLAFSPHYILRGQIWRIITFIFVPTSSELFLLALTLYFYYFVGSTLEHIWGKGRFTIFYASGILLTVIYGFIAGYAFNSLYPVNPHYLNLSLFLPLAIMHPNERIMLFFVIPVKFKWLAWLDIAYILLDMYRFIFVYNAAYLVLLPLVALLNVAIFCIEPLLEGFGLLRHRVSPQTINFKRAAKESRRRQQGQGQYSHNSNSKAYTRKCAVCGRTDTDFPELEFRYCSRCAGYHCFCIDHINSHVHFQE